MSIIKTDMAKAKELHRDKIREERQPLLNALDIEFQKALETDDATKKAEVIAKKQALRDAPADSAIDAATDEASLKTQWNTNILGTSPYTS
tara:strand:+ start:172 stop:444 length:273 start_codon:yes stop_codon:yes gene_type:complete